VAAGRPKLTEDQVRALADGRVYNGTEALRLGLVDGIGGWREALEMAMELGGIPADSDPPVILEDGRGHWLEELLGVKLGLFGAALDQAAGPGPALKFLYRPGLF
jgi:ClpP class serine protease